MVWLRKFFVERPELLSSKSLLFLTSSTAGTCTSGYVQAVPKVATSMRSASTLISQLKTASFESFRSITSISSATGGFAFPGELWASFLKLVDSALSSSDPQVYYEDQTIV